MQDYQLSQSKQLDYLHNLLYGDAKLYYLHTVYGYATNFQQAIYMVESEYNSIVREKRVKNYLNTIRMIQFGTKGLDPPAALEKVYKLVTKLARQVPQAFREDSHRVDFLRKSVVGYDWATEPLSRITTDKLNFQQLYGELESDLNLHREARLATLHDSVSKKLKKANAKELPAIYF